MVGRRILGPTERVDYGGEGSLYTGGSVVRLVQSPVRPCAGDGLRAGRYSDSPVPGKSERNSTSLVV